MKQNYENPLTNRFITDNDRNECDLFTKWKWDALINAIEIGTVDESYLVEHNYIKNKDA